MRGFRLGRILGLEIRIDYSWFIIFVLILWTLTSGVFPAEHPGLSAGVYVAMGLGATLAFFASLLAHELSHSLVARRVGVEVESITLFIFGGMARMRREAQRPRDELVIAGAGPLMSLLLAAAFGILAWAGGEAGLGEPVTAVAGYLSYINLALAVFNLLPGFPLDGGRLFRAIAWWATGDLTRATRWAAGGGRALGYLLIGVGVLMLFLFGDLLGGMWLIFIGWFIRTAADLSFTQHVLVDSLRGVRVADVMTPDPVTVPAGLSVSEFVDSFVLQGRHQAYPVRGDEPALGLVSLAAVKGVPRHQWDALTVREIMRPVEPDAMVAPDTPMSEALEQLARAPEGRVLVARGVTLVGIVTRADLTRWIERARLIGRAPVPSAQDTPVRRTTENAAAARRRRQRTPG